MMRFFQIWNTQTYRSIHGLFSMSLCTKPIPYHLNHNSLKTASGNLTRWHNSAISNSNFLTLNGNRSYSDGISVELEDAAFKIHFANIPHLGSRTKLAALYMQASRGPNDTPEPTKEMQIERAYWTAWKQLGDMPQKDAEEAYIQSVKLFLKDKFDRDYKL